MPNTLLLTPEILEAALEGLKMQKQRTDDQIAQVRAQLFAKKAPTTPAEPAGAPAKKRRRLSAAARMRISVAQKKRWAEAKKAKKKSGKA